MLEYKVGSTPLVELPSIHDNRVFAKIEKDNFLGSIKARTAYAIVKNLPEEAKGKTLIESTSGNLGLALGYFSKEIGYDFLCLVDATIASAKLEKLKLQGIRYELVEKRTDMDYRNSRIQRANELMSTNEYYWVNQYDNPAGIDIHYMTTGPEIFEQTCGTITDIVCPMGSCGTICGLSKFMKEKDSSIRVVGTEPYGSTIFGSFEGSYINVGAGLVGKPGNLIHSHAKIDVHMTIKDEESIRSADELFHKFGLAVGVTSGMCYTAIKHLAETVTGHTFVFIASDGRESYTEYLH